MRRGFGGERVEPYYHERHKLGRRPRLRKGPTDTLPNSRYGFAGEVCWWGELYENRSDRVVMEWLRLDAHAAVRFDKEYVELERFTYDGPLLRSYVCVRETWMWWHEQYSYAGERLIEVRLAGSNEPTGEIFHEVHRLSYDGDELVRVDADALDWGVTIRLL